MEMVMLYYHEALDIIVKVHWFLGKCVIESENEVHELPSGVPEDYGYTYIGHL